MELAADLRRALDGLCAIGAPEVRENGEKLSGLAGVQYEVTAQGDAALLHLWSAQQSLVRRVLRVAEQSTDRVVLEVSRLGFSRNAQIEFVAVAAPRETHRIEREQFSTRFRRLLTDHFPDEVVESLVTSADLHHSISGSYTRAMVRRGSEAYAVLGASPNEDAATIDGILTFGLIWLQHTRDRARRCSCPRDLPSLRRIAWPLSRHRMKWNCMNMNRCIGAFGGSPVRTPEIWLRGLFLAEKSSRPLPPPCPWRSVSGVSRLTPFAWAQLRETRM
jgi:hypothetical protein